MDLHDVREPIEESIFHSYMSLLVLLQGQSSEWVMLEYSHPNPTQDDWIGVFSPAKFR